MCDPCKLPLDGHLHDVQVLGMKLGAYLGERGETAVAFAARVGLSESSLSRIIAGKQRPAHGTIGRIVAATGGAVQPNDFFDLPSPAAGEGAAGAIVAVRPRTPSLPSPVKGEGDEPEEAA
jgi:transcriptional regulator with XRE-family HTH domain